MTLSIDEFRRRVLDNVRRGFSVSAPSVAGSVARGLAVSRLVTLLLVTDEVRAKRLEVPDEVRNGLYFLTNSIWEAVPRRMRDPGTVAKLRASDDASALYTLLTQQVASNAA